MKLSVVTYYVFIEKLVLIFPFKYLYSFSDMNPCSNKNNLHNANSACYDYAYILLIYF